MTDRMAGIPRSFVHSSVVVGLLGLGATVFAMRGATSLASAELLVLAAAALISENFALSLPSFNISLAFPLVVAAFVLMGPAGGTVVAALCFTNYDEITHGRPLPPLLYNLGQLVLAACAGGYVYELTGGQVLWFRGGFQTLDAARLPRTAVAVLVAALVVFLLNIVLTARAASLLRGCSLLGAAKEMVAYLPTQLALALVGLLMAEVIAIDPFALLLFLFPLVLARQVYLRYEDLKGAYLGTVRSLVAALEAKDPYTRGHSERVAEYAERIGRELGLDEAAMLRLQTSALLHDVGKLIVAREVLTKPSALSSAEVAAMHRHPDVGADLVSKIPPLKGIEANVRMHHERIDGSGYPAGASGRQIPLAARILAVADAYDAMTSERAYRHAMTRESAFAELFDCADRQFDADVVMRFFECENRAERVWLERVPVRPLMVEGAHE